MTKQHSTLTLLYASTLLLNPVMAWSPFKRRNANSATFDPIATHSPMTVSTLDSRLFFRNGQEIESESLLSSLFIYTDVSPSSNLPTPTTTTAVPSSVTNTMEPRLMDLPRHSPPKEIAQWQKVWLDVEMIIGRLCMVTALVLMANEVMTGSSLSDQVTRLFG
jgi:hypothetical protein